MARIRTIKPEFWQHPKVMAVSRDARLMFIGLLNEADDEGRLRFQAKRLSGVIFPGDDDVDCADLLRWTGELEGVGLIVRYEVEGAQFVVLPGFTEHQKINRPSESKLPPPPFTEGSVRDHGGISDGSLPEQGTGNREHENSSSTKGLTDAYEECFTRWWEDYPRKVNRKAAMNAYKARRREGVSHDRLIIARDHYALSRMGEPDQFTMHGSTFLAKDGPWSEWESETIPLKEPVYPWEEEPKLVLPPARVDVCPECESSMLACVCRRSRV